MSTTFGLDFAFPTVYRDLQTWEPQPHPQTPLCPPAAPPLSLPSLGAPVKTPKATHRMWLAMDSLLLCHIYFVLFESLTCSLRGQ